MSVPSHGLELGLAPPPPPTTAPRCTLRCIPAMAFHPWAPFGPRVGMEMRSNLVLSGGCSQFPGLLIRAAHEIERETGLAQIKVIGHPPEVGTVYAYIRLSNKPRGGFRPESVCLG